MAERCAGAEAVITNKALVSRETIEALPELRYLGVTATGVNVVDCEAAAERGIPVTNVPGYGPKSVAQTAFAHVLNLTQRVGHTRRLGGRPLGRLPGLLLRRLSAGRAGRAHLGILGYGNIGQETARIGRAFGMKVIAHSRSLHENLEGEVEAVTLADLFRLSDVLSLHCPLTPETEEVVNAESLATMKPNAFLINTGRGQLVDEQSLAEALDNGRIAGAGLDVLSTEPPSLDNPLPKAKNCYVTPHYAWATSGARQRLLDASVANLQAFLTAPRRVVTGFEPAPLLAPTFRQTDAVVPSVKTTSRKGRLSPLSRPRTCCRGRLRGRPEPGEVPVLRQDEQLVSRQDEVARAHAAGGPLDLAVAQANATQLGPRSCLP